MKSMCISICGVNLWNGLDTELRQSLNINVQIMFERYSDEEGLVG